LIDTRPFAYQWQNPGSPCVQALFTLDPAKLGVASARSISVCLTYRGSHLAKFSNRDTQFVVNIVGARGTVEACVHDLTDWLLDWVASKVVVGDEAELMLVHPSSSGGVWLCGMCRNGNEWLCNAVDTDRPPSISTSYALPENPEQFQDLTETHRAFMNFAEVVLVPTTSRKSPCLLRVKVHPNERWFLRFPLGIFSKFHLEGFEHYSACQWIVTERTISAVAASQSATEREMANTVAFLAGAHIVLNTYRAHASARESASIEAGFDMLIQLLSQFQDIPVLNQRLSLKWTMNPLPDQLFSTLTSSDTRFLFADFEAAGGIWTIGDGPHRCYAACDHVQRPASDLGFGLCRVQGKLGHIRLMRVFHCNSLYDPYRVGSEPAADETIAAALLATNAFFVEGSVTAEPVIDFICTMLNLLLGRSDLRAILFAKSLKGECDVSGLIARANELLCKRGFLPIQ
jgi:hypothetical protein